MNKQVYVVTRHENVVKWVINEQLIDPNITHMIKHIDDTFIERLNVGDVVIGIIPIHYAAQICAKTATPVFILSLPRIKQEQRGKELSLEEMEDVGATLDGFFVETDNMPLLDYLA